MSRKGKRSEREEGGRVKYQRSIRLKFGLAYESLVVLYFSTDVLHALV